MIRHSMIYHTLSCTNQMMNNLHITIKRYRAVYVALLVFVCWLTVDMWEWYKVNSEALEMASGGAFGAAFLAMLGMIKYGLEGLREDSEHN